MALNDAQAMSELYGCCGTIDSIILHDVLNATYKKKPPLMSLASVLRIELKGMLGLMSEHIIPLRQNINEK